MASKRGKNERTGSAPVAGNRQWEGPLSTAVLHEESWDVCVSLVVCASVYDEVCMRALCQAVQQPLRRLFTLLSWENLLQKVNDLGNPKTRKTKELPAFYEVTEAAKSVLDSGDKLSVDLLTKLVKFQLLDIKSADIQRRAAAQKAPATVVPVKEKSDKGKKGTETPPPPKDTALKRRGDVSDVSYIDDEPDDGPQHYVLMTGFHQPSLISALDSVGVHVSSVIRLRSDRSQTPSAAQEEERDGTSEERKFPAGASDLQQELGLFWGQLEGVLNSTGFQSRLSDVARLDYRVDQNLLSRDLNKAREMQEVGVAVFEGVACLLYDSLDWRRQHQHYLSSMRLIDVPDLHTPVHKLRPDTPAEAVPVKKRAELSSGTEHTRDNWSKCVVGVDMRLYSDLLDRLPVHCVSVPLILHCLIEQVASSEAHGVPAQRESRSEPELMPCVAQAAGGASRGGQQDAELMEYFGHKEEDHRTDRSPALLHHHDERSKRLNHIHVLEGLDVVSAEVCVMKTDPLWNTLMCERLDSCSLSAARRHELLHYCSTDSLSPADVQRFLQLCVFESMPLTAVDADGVHTPVVSHTVLPWDDPVNFTHTVYRGLNATHDSTAGCDEQQDNKVSAADLQKTLSRHFRHWNYTEHHSADVFPQVVQTVSEAYECVDSYLSSQSSVLYVMCHSPMSPERSSRGSWEVSVHTDVSFRSYLENVAESIRDWIRVEEEERRQKQQQQQRESETLDTSMKGVSPVSEVFIRNDSLKAWKMEKDRQKDEDVTKKTKKETKSSAKGGERAESTREEEHHTSPSGTESRSDTHLTHDTHERSDDHTHTEKQPVFTGYRMGGRLVQVRGETQSVYPSDGGQISVERIHYVQGSTQLKVCVKKDGHCFYTHITEPERQNTHGQSEKCGCFYAVLSNGLTLAYSHTHQDVDAPPLQLHVSLPTGLQIHFSFQHTEQGQAVLVRQSLPLSGFGLPATHTESSRTITCDGAVIRHMRDGSTAVLFTDGTVSVSPDSGPVCVSTSAGWDVDTSTHTQRRDTKVKPSSDTGVEGVEPTARAELKEQVKVTGGLWCTTTPSGVRIRTIRGEQVEENPVLTFYSTDPQTHSVLMTRDDGVMCVSEKHRAVVDHADGTRITSSYQQREQRNSGSRCDGGRASEVKMEKSGYATVRMKCEEKSAEVLFRDGTTISATALGSYRVRLSDGGCLSVREDGVAVYSSTGPEGNQCGRYIMSHSQGLVCEVTDSEGNQYQVTAEGRVSISHTHSDTERKAQQNIGLDTHIPRLFVVYADGSALEFLSSQTVDEILQKENTDPSVAVLREPIPHTHEAFAITILKPFSDLNSYWLSPEHLDDIIPANLKSRKWDTFPASEVKIPGPPFGLSLGRGLQLKERTGRGSDPTPTVLQNPDTLLIRRITQHTPLTQHYEHLQDKLMMYMNQLLQREKLKDEMKMKDPQTAEEELHHSDLQLLQSQSDSTPESTPEFMLSLYSQAVGMSQSPSTNETKDTKGTECKQKSEWGNRIRQHRLDLQEESNQRSALRNHMVTPYFHPELQEMRLVLQQELKVTSGSQNLPSLPKIKR